MKRVIITTCGTSLLSSSCWKYEHLNEKHLSKLDYIERSAHGLKCYSLLKQAADNGDNISEEFDIISWKKFEFLRDLPAELASLRAIQLFFKYIKKEPLDEGDKVILLYSDEIEGAFCGKQIYNILLKQNLLPKVSIDEWIVSGIDPNRDDNFKKSLDEIWKKSFHKFNDSEEEYYLNLTAGYKAVVILLGAFAYTNDNTSIFYLPEEVNYEKILVTSFGPEFNNEGVNTFHTDCFILKKEDYTSDGDPGSNDI